jgi:glycosyltransferase involved in cell wall biosynthesis
MRVTMLSKALVVGAYQRKCELIAEQPDIDLTVLVPLMWRTGDRQEHLERTHTRGYVLREVPMRFNGNFHLHYYPSLRAELTQSHPDIVHIDEEPYNTATFLAMRDSHAVGARAVFFSWQNLLRKYPPPFRWMEQYILTHADGAIAGNQDAVTVLRAKGYAGTPQVIPQFGVDADIFQPLRRPTPPGVFTVGYAGRLVKEKGVDLILHALSRLPNSVHATLIGAGDERTNLVELATQLKLGDRVAFLPPAPSAQMPFVYAQLDALVLPSRSQPNWKEQFGRVLIEAMACGVPVIGSQCGEIPNVIGDAGLVFPEDDSAALAVALRTLLEKPELHADLAVRGRDRVLARYTMRRIASETVDVYRSILQMK